jgi:hypothetical protein
MEDEKGWGGRVMFMSFALIGTRVFENLSYPSPSAVPFFVIPDLPPFFYFISMFALLFFFLLLQMKRHNMRAFNFDV